MQLLTGRRGRRGEPIVASWTPGGLIMHELAIAQSIFDTLSRRLGEAGYRRIEAVGLRIGELTDLVPDALEFGFTMIAGGTPLAHTRLEIEAVPITGRCASCAKTFPVERFRFVCPGCGTQDIAVASGNELEIAYLKVDAGDEDGRTATAATAEKRICS